MGGEPICPVCGHHLEFQEDGSWVCLCGYVEPTEEKQP